MSDSLEKSVTEVLIEVFPSLNGSINYDWGPNEIEEWDSIGHMTLVAALEEEYKITLETDDIIDFSSFKKGIEILKKYKVEI